MSIEKKEKSPLELFRSEIQGMVNDERELGETGHFESMEGEPSFDAQELDEEDRILYRKFKNGLEISPDELMARRRILDESGKQSQKLLLGYIANKIQNRFMDER